MAEPQKRKHTTITIPVTLFELLKAKIEKTGFTSVSDYATYLLRETVIKMEKDEAKSHKMSKAQEEKIMEKFKALGYI
jgi:Arc/MetJ-type ribon-helix-helix transcriptional regulator